ncbi:MAG: pilus assembly protein, partial [Clostridia bacterium]|nr:pilus assembly protein [Clostridia bacterium]
MKKNTRGILTVEASIVLTLFTLFVLFLFSFARVYRAQNAVSHAVLQAADAIALESNLRESTLSIDESEILDISEGLTGSSAVTPDNFKSLRGANLSEIAKQKFSAAISGSEGDTDKILKKLGIKDGLSGIDFSSSVIDYTNNDIIIYANYVIEMQFPIMGMNEINATKASKAKAFSDILFEIITVPDNALHGSTAGNGSYNYGDEIEITATPAFGYIFMGWDTDGDSVSDTSADLVQTITVDSTKKYTGIFYTDDYRVELSVKSGKGSVETVHEGITSIGGGAYEGYSSLTVNAIPDIGYKFSGWEGYWFKDLNGDNIYNLGEFREDLADIEDATFAIDYITGHYCLSAVFEKKEINIITMVEGIE